MLGIKMGQTAFWGFFICKKIYISIKNELYGYNLHKMEFLWKNKKQAANGRPEKLFQKNFNSTKINLDMENKAW